MRTGLGPASSLRACCERTHRAAQPGGLAQNRRTVERRRFRHVGGDDSPGKDVNKKRRALSLGDSRDLFRPKTSDIPAQPGVYKWRDGEGRVIYVGKAKNLRNRLTNYFQPLYQLHPRTQTMVLTARNLEWTVVGTELESSDVGIHVDQENLTHDSTLCSATTKPIRIWRSHPVNACRGCG